MIGVILVLFLIALTYGILKPGGWLYEKNEQKMIRLDEFHNDLFGDRVFIFTPQDSPEEVASILEEMWKQQETNQFGEERYGVYFMPGTYDSSIKVMVGYYMDVAGLGKLPTDTVISSLNCDARWLGDDSNHNACCNFWRGVSNLTVENDVMWAVSQATFLRRMNIKGNLSLHDNYGWASGGFLADSVIEGVVDSGSQQQWLSRNSHWNLWIGENWNMVFVGMEAGDAPKGTWPGTKYTTVAETPEIAEKPYLYYDQKKGYMVHVPDIRTNSTGISWEADKGRDITMEECYIANSDIDISATINEALSSGKNLILTPGIYHLKEALQVQKQDTVILGMGLATLIPDNGNACIEIADVPGVRIAGILFDAGALNSKVLLAVGSANNSSKTDLSNKNPMVLSDLFFRVGGNPGYVAQTESCVTIDADNVIGDNFWVWRADHGDGVAWDQNRAANGIIVNGDAVTIYALMVEHFQEYQTIWNGNEGKVYFYQSEIPYDVPDQKSWMSQDGTVNGYASYKVAEDVTSHEAYGLGIYLYNRDAKVDLFSAMEVPDGPEVKIHNICTVMLTGNPGISHIINDQGGSCLQAGERQIITDYCQGIEK